MSNCAAVPFALDRRNENVSNVKLAVASVNATAMLPVPRELPPSRVADGNLTFLALLLD